jgi:hypothetical protein
MYSFSSHLLKRSCELHIQRERKMGVLVGRGGCKSAIHVPRGRSCWRLAGPLRLVLDLFMFGQRGANQCFAHLPICLTTTTQHLHYVCRFALDDCNPSIRQRVEYFDTFATRRRKFRMIVPDVTHPPSCPSEAKHFSHSRDSSHPIRTTGILLVCMLFHCPDGVLDCVMNVPNGGKQSLQATRG